MYRVGFIVSLSHFAIVLFFCTFVFVFRVRFNNNNNYGRLRIADADIIFLPCGFFYPLSSIFFFFPRLISAVADWMSMLPHMVWP